MAGEGPVSPCRLQCPPVPTTRHPRAQFSLSRTSQSVFLVELPREGEKSQAAVRGFGGHKIITLPHYHYMCILSCSLIL